MRKKTVSKSKLPSRNELLEWLTSAKGEITDGTLLDDARRRFHEILLASNSPAALEWLFNQLMGTPRSTVVHVIESEELLKAVSRVTARYVKGPDFERWWGELKGELQGDAALPEA